MEKTLQARGREREKKNPHSPRFRPWKWLLRTLRTKAEWEIPPSAPLSSRPYHSTAEFSAPHGGTGHGHLRVLRSITTIICDRISGLGSCELVGGLKPEASS